MEGVDIYAVGQILGHKTPRMTQRYVHLSPGYMAAAVGKLDGIFAGSLQQLPATILEKGDRDLGFVGQVGVPTKGDVLEKGG
jgi:hypothetical protein